MPRPRRRRQFGHRCCSPTHLTGSLGFRAPCDSSTGLGFRVTDSWGSGLWGLDECHRNSCQLPYIGLLGIWCAFLAMVFSIASHTHTHITPCNMGSEDRRRKVHAAKRLANRPGSFRKCESAYSHQKLTCHPTCPGPTPKPKPLNPTRYLYLLRNLRPQNPSHKPPYLACLVAPSPKPQAATEWTPVRRRSFTRTLTWPCLRLRGFGASELWGFRAFGFRGFGSGGFGFRRLRA